MAYLNRDGVQYYFEVQGTGSPLLLLPGFATDALSWGTVGEQLAREYQVIAVDHRGAGRTRSQGSFRLEDLAQDALALLDHLGHRSAHVIGHSMGGLVAMLMALEAPERVDHLVLAGAYPKLSARNLHLFRDWGDIRASGINPARYYRTLLAWVFAPALFEEPGMIEATTQAALDYPFIPTPEQFRAQVEALAACDVRGRLATLRHPTLVLSGGEDILVPPSTGDALAVALGGVRHLVIPGAGHAIHLDAPDVFLEAVRAFLEGGA